MNDQQADTLLQQLESVHLPAVSMVPAVGWWVVLALLCALAAFAWWLRKRYHAKQWQRQARAEVKRLRAQLTKVPAGQTLAETSRLARQILLKVSGREAVANLHGEPWLEALDAICERPLFATGFGKLLQSGPYQREPEVGANDLDSLMDAMEALIGAAGRHMRRGK